MSITTTNTITLGFLDDQGQQFNVSLSRVKDLTDATGKTLVNAAMDAMMTNQPYENELVAKRQAYQTETIKTSIELS